jgi:uncharacterized membrane protein
MPFCTQCRTAVADADKYCPSCGAAVNRPAEQGSRPVEPSPPAPAQPQAAPGASASISLTASQAGLLAYAFGFISGVILLNVQPWSQDRTVRFHAFQSIFFAAALIVLFVAASIVAAVLSLGSPLGVGGLTMLLNFVVWAGGIALWLVLMVKAYRGERLMLPIIGRLAERAAEGPSAK